MTVNDSGRPIRHLASTLIDADVANFSPNHENNEMEFRILRSDNSERWIRWRGKVIQKPGLPVRVVGINLDLTWRKRTEKIIGRTERDLALEKERRRLIVELTGEGVCEITKSNDCFCRFGGCRDVRLFGGRIDRQEIVGHGHPDAVEENAEFHSQLLAGNNIEGKRAGMHKDGCVVKIHFRAGPAFEAGELTRIIGTIRLIDGPD